MLEKDEIVSRRPDDGAFYQQRLPAWKPIINIHTTIPVFGILGIILIPIGLLLITTAGSVQETRLDYSLCNGCENRPYTEQCTCEMEFNLESKYKGRTILMYYGLERYYQNHRKYATSRSDQQLRGYPQYSDSKCEPYEKEEVAGEKEGSGKVYAPCGLIANSMFNDTFKLEFVARPEKSGPALTASKHINFTRKGIAWESDHGVKFRNPAGNDLAAAFNGTTKPASWSKAPFELDPLNPSNNAFLNEPFIVWMRVAAFPTFRKLYSRIEMDLNPELDDGLEEGTYRLTIDYKYPVLYYKSRKYFVLSTTSMFGSRNLMIGVVYLVVGAVLLLLALAFAVIAKRDMASFFNQ